MVVLDLTVMNIALPSAQRALHFTTVDRQCVVTACTLAFGRGGASERMRILAVGGRSIRVPAREGSPGLAAAAAVQRHRREHGAG
jgi:hypothetical protein